MSDLSYKVGVVGLGYVGFELFQCIKKNNINVVGFDIQKSKVTKIIKNYKFEKKVSTNSAILKNCNIYLVCVPTPIFKNKKPDFRPLKSACEILKKYLKKKDIVVFESTVYPGVIKNICIPKLLSKNITNKNKIFNYGYSPERYSPGEEKKNRKYYKDCFR